MISTELPIEVVNTVAAKYHMTNDAVRELYRGYWKFVREFIDQQDLSVTGQYNDVTDIIIPYIGTFYLNFKKQSKYNSYEPKGRIKN